MPKAKKKKVVRVEEPQEGEADEAGEGDPTPSSPAPRPPASKAASPPASPSKAVLSALGLRVREAKSLRKEAEAKLNAAGKEFKLNDRLQDAMMDRIDRALKQKGYKDSYWRPRLEKVELRWWESRLKKVEAYAWLNLVEAAVQRTQLEVCRAKMRSIRRRLRKRRVFGLLRW